MAASAADYPTYDDYVDARRAEGLQVIPRMLWEALKEAIEEGEYDV